MPLKRTGYTLLQHLLRSLLLLLFGLPVWEANAEETPLQKELRPITSATTLSLGKHRVLESYFSPIHYGGFTIGLDREWMQRTRWGKNRFTQQHLFSIDLSTLSNPSQTGTIWSAFANYRYGLFYNFHPLRNLQLLGGAYIGGEIGALYNLRNSNNPVSAKLSIDLGLSALAIYTLRIQNYPITLRYQISNPIFGIFFMPPYGASYYEIFSLGNTHDIVHVGSLHNQVRLENLFTLDFPVGSFHIRIGYQNQLIRYRANHLKTRMSYNQFLIGFTRTLIPINRKRAKTLPIQLANPYYAY